MLTGDLHTRLRMIASLLSLCSKATIEVSVEKMRQMVVCVIIISLRFVDCKGLLQDCLGDVFVDWEYIESQRVKGVGNFLGDSSLWMELLHFVHFERPKMSEPELGKRFPLLSCIQGAMKESHSMDFGPVARHGHAKLHFDDVCKVFIGMNVSDIPSKTMTQAHLNCRLTSDTSLITNAVVAASADMRQEKEAYSQTFLMIFGSMHMDTDALLRLMEHYKRNTADLKEAWKLKNSGSRTSRPSLRRIAERVCSGTPMYKYSGAGPCDASELESESCSGSSVAPRPCAATSDQGLQWFLDTVRFPNSMSRIIRVRCYLLAAQAHNFEFQKHTARLVSQHVAQKINENPVIYATPDDLCKGIETLVMNRQPFAELIQFKQICLASMALMHQNSLTLTQRLQLYVCAYQRREVWKACWKQVYPLISPQIIKDVEKFVASRKMDEQSVVDVLVTSSPFHN